ncbi:MAG: methyltransferase domain-containing protein [Deltaproteobacteria bacterium]|nr:methyltransferase domain-containing protein [Deltaproteobacteria bacterium]
MNAPDTFDRFKQKLSKNVYGSVKGVLRLTLLEKDLLEFCPGFTGDSLSILDAGCGEGAFANICLSMGHRLVLLDGSVHMVEKASRRCAKFIERGMARVVRDDFLQWDEQNGARFDVVLMHGSAEWMADSRKAILKGVEMLRPGGILSLLMFNRDVHDMKRGINGHLIDGTPSRKKKLFPPQSQRVADTEQILRTMSGRVLLQSGIRIFHGFFRQMRSREMEKQQWIQQELMYYREKPFTMLGQHSHFVWQKNTSLDSGEF